MKYIFVYIQLATVVLIYLAYTYFVSWKSQGNIAVTYISNRSEQLINILRCFDKPLRSSIKEYSNYWVFYNFISAERIYKCHESITFTTIGDLLHVDNLITTVKRWNGPISVALYAPGDDFYTTLNSIAYLRNCQNSAFKEYVTFHIIMDYDHFPPPILLNQTIVPLTEIYNDYFNCSLKPPYAEAKLDSLYKKKNNLTFPINIARNVARESAQTHFVLAADIELYPSENIIDTFLNLVFRQQHLFQIKSRNVFVLPIFEVHADIEPPLNKDQLVKLFKNKKAFLFHQNLCLRCHNIPKFKEWINLTINEVLNVFTSTKRNNKFSDWEPFYIGTNNEPTFETRIHWENGGDKMTQNYKQCLLDYDYLILDNAFIVHKPGIKTFSSKNPDIRNRPTRFTKSLLNKEYSRIYGQKYKC
ncbi:hypothetical protein FQA39_LY08407 [Lamprigera yunnana]|nr:hypothetical protein FQA39_LY08407 [Lamprigera yunnana]